MGQQRSTREAGLDMLRKFARRGSRGLPLLFALLWMGDLAWSLKERAMPDLFKAQLREFSQGTLLLNLLFGAVPALIALLIGPLVGAWSDRIRTPIGRRIPFLLVCAPLASASIAGLAFSRQIGLGLWQWSGAGAGQREHYIVACMCVLWTLYELFTIVTNALFVALINDTVPRRMLGRFFGMFRVISLSVGVCFFYFVFGNALPAVASGVMLAIAAVYLVGFLLLCKGVREPAYPPPAPVAGWGLPRSGDGAAPWFYWLLFATLAVATICVLPVNINSYNAIGQFGVDRTDYGRAVAATYSISILLALPIGWLSDRYHPLRVGLVVLTLYAVCMLGAWWLVSGRVSFLIWFIVHGVLAGSFLTGTAALLPTLLPRARFSALAALSAAITALLTVVFTLGMGILLDWNGHDFRAIFLAAGLVAALGATCWRLLLAMHGRKAQQS